MDAHRIDILDRTHDDGIVRTVADHLHLIFLPPEQRLLDQHLGRRRRVEAFADDAQEFVAVIRHTTASPAQRERRADDRRQPDMLEARKRLRLAMRDMAARGFEADLVHRDLELLTVLGLVDRFGIGADHRHAELFERAVLRQCQRGVQRRLSAHRRQDGVGPLLLDDPGDDRRGDRLDIGRVGQIGIGHDRRGVGIDEDDAIALLLQRLDRLHARIIELAGLTDDDRPRADDEDGRNVGAFGH